MILHVFVLEKDKEGESYGKYTGLSGIFTISGRKQIKEKGDSYESTFRELPPNGERT